MPDAVFSIVKSSKGQQLFWMLKANKSEFIGFLNGYDIEKSKEAIAFGLANKGNKSVIDELQRLQSEQTSKLDKILEAGDKYIEKYKLVYS